MPGLFLLHQGATIQCLHAGQAQATAPVARVLVNGFPIVTQAVPHLISGCTFVLPSGTPSPCLTAQWTVASTRVKSLGVPVLLFNSQAVCVPNGTPVTVTNQQTRVSGL